LTKWYYPISRNCRENWGKSSASFISLLMINRHASAQMVYGLCKTTICKRSLVWVSHASSFNFNIALIFLLHFYFIIVKLVSILVWFKHNHLWKTVSNICLFII
jgi:hypothetical protein